MTDPTGDALRTYRAQVSEAKRAAVIAVLDDAADAPYEVSIAAIARLAGVSREFIHSHGDLHGRVKHLAATRSAARHRVNEDSADLEAGRVADRSTLMNKVLRQRERITELTEKVSKLEASRARLLGERLLQMDAAPQIDAQEMLVTAEHLASENERLQRELGETLRLVSRLRDELAGARQALSEALLRTPAEGAAPIPLLPRS